MEYKEYKLFKDEVPPGFEEFRKLNILLEFYNYGKEDLHNDVLNIIYNLKNNIKEELESLINLEIFNLIYNYNVNVLKILIFGELKYKSYYNMCLEIIEIIYEKNEILGRLLYKFIDGYEEKLTIENYNGAANVRKIYDYNKINLEDFYSLLGEILEIYQEQNTTLH